MHTLQSRGRGRSLQAIAGAAVAAAIAGLGMVPAHAQGSSGAETGAIEEVTVTARRREETLQDVPVAVTAFSGDRLEAAGAETSPTSRRDAERHPGELRAPPTPR